jgi:dihydrofolate reductase
MPVPTSPIIAAIVAMAENRVIGNKNQLPWHLPADLAHFKQLTTQHPIVMGRKTYLSIGKPLPNRTNIVLTQTPDFQAPGCFVAADLDQALKQAMQHEQEIIFIIGGAQIYQVLLPRIQRIYLTIVHASFAGDVYFPPLDQSQWREISRNRYEADNKNPYPYSFIELERI